MSRVEIPAAPLDRFLQIYAALNAERGCLGDASSLRFSAITALTTEGSPEAIARELREVAEDLQKQTSWFGALRSPLRFVIAAILLQQDDSPADYLAEVQRVRKLFREVQLRRSEVHEAMAILCLRSHRDRAPIPMADVNRFKSLYEEMKKHHWWLTGPEDFPACAILVHENGTPEEIGERIEQIYQALRSHGFSQGDALQTSANMLTLAHRPALEVAQRFRNLNNGFKAAGVRIGQGDYDELAILTFLSSSPESIVQTLLEHRASISKIRPRVNRNASFNLSASTTFLTLLPQTASGRDLAQVKALLDLQSVIEAQQAAAAAAASTAAAS